jgi:exopolysaccharide production protein ExoZ
MATTDDMRPIASVQLLRAAAAISVALLHFGANLAELTGTSISMAWAPLAAGVDVFFVISGFIMAYSAEPLFGAPHASSAFLIKRIARIIPLYWMALTITAVMTAPLGWRDALMSYAFIPHRGANGNIHPILGVGWTLDFEMFFYLVFAMAVAWKRPVAIAALLAFFVADVALGLAFRPQTAALLVWSDPIVLEFVLGLGLALLYRRGVRLPAPVRAAAAIAAVIAISQFFGRRPPSNFRVIEWGLPAAVLVAAAVLGDGNWAETRLARIGAILGDASYSIYLLHTLVLMAFIPLLPRDLSPPAALAALSLCFVLMLAVSVLSCRYYERPMSRLIKRRLQGAASSRAMRAASPEVAGTPHAAAQPTGIKS